MPGTSQGQAGTSRDKAGQTGIRQGQTGTNRDKQGNSLSVPACPCLYILVPVCPCLSMFVPAWPCRSLCVLVCPCMSLSVSVCIYICHTFIGTPADELKSLHQYEHSSIDFPGKIPCSNACNLNSSILVINIKRAPPGFFFKFSFFFQCKLCHKWLWFSIFLMNIHGCWFKLFTNSFLKKILDADRITLWALNFWLSTLARVTSQNSWSLVFMWALQLFSP